MPGEGIPPSRPNSLFADAGSIAVVGLVLLGVIGLAYQMLRPGGWLGSTLDYLREKSLGLIWLAGFGVVLAAAAARGVFLRRRKQTYDSDLLLYIGVSLGLFFLLRLVAIGSL